MPSWSAADIDIETARPTGRCGWGAGQGRQNLTLARYDGCCTFRALRINKVIAHYAGKWLPVDAIYAATFNSARGQQHASDQQIRDMDVGG